MSPCLEVEEFDLAATLQSGQVFHWECRDGVWHGLDGENLLVVQQESKNKLRILHGKEARVRRYFALDHPMEAIYRSFPKDPFTKAAVRQCRGLRILRQPIWECLATFLFSSMKQVSHIRTISLRLREKFGRPVKGSPVAAFPGAQVLADCRADELRKYGLGYRAEYLAATARAVAEGRPNLTGLRKLGNDALCGQLCQLPGVGPKIAACVMLFAYERLDAVPVDVWIDRVLEHQTGSRMPSKDRLAFLQSLGQHAGYLQQYWFHHARVHRALATA
jgi:N-glycosylase/DNA lyase